MKEKKDSFLKDVVIIVLSGIIVNVVCLFLSLNVKAATNSELLPYNLYYGNSQYNSFYSSSVSSIIHNNVAINSFLSDADSYIIVPWSVNPSNMYLRIIKNPIYDDTIDINTFDYSTNSFVIASNSSLYFQMYFYSNGNSPVITGITQNNSLANYLILGSRNTQNFVNNTLVTAFYPVEIEPLIQKNNDNEKILVFTQEYNPTTSDFIGSALIGHSDNNNQPNSPIITLPSIDSSLGVIDNVKILFQWLGDTIKSLLFWVITSVLAFFDNLVSNLKAFINAVIMAINNGFRNIYNNFVSLFFPFISFFTAFAKGLEENLEDFFDNFIPFIKQRINDFVGFFTSLIDNIISIKNFLFGIKGFFDTYGVIWNQQTWEEALDNSEWLNAVSDNTATISQFFNGTLNVAEPQTAPVFTLDFRNSFYNFGLCTIDLSWYEPYKHSVRLAFLSICILNVVLYFIDESPNWFSGGGSNKKGDK